ncbi:hypothetical protein TNCV_831421 [Trichonephila clavipes]|nr:hypothetical protein TNCV_831421 [Trichonephila clavipes]
MGKNGIARKTFGTSERDSFEGRSCAEKRLCSSVSQSGTQIENETRERPGSSWSMPYDAPGGKRTPRSARGLLAMDHVILNHDQVTWATPELAPNGKTFQFSTDLACIAALHGGSLDSRTRDKASHDPIPISLGYRGHLAFSNFLFT